MLCTGPFALYEKSLCGSYQQNQVTLLPASGDAGLRQAACKGNGPTAATGRRGPRGQAGWPDGFRRAGAGECESARERMRKEPRPRGARAIPGWPPLPAPTGTPADRAGAAAAASGRRKTKKPRPSTGPAHFDNVWRGKQAQIAQCAE
jgi:hypothetical protein